MVVIALFEFLTIALMRALANRGRHATVGDHR